MSESRRPGFDPWVLSQGREDPLEKEMAAHSSTLAWKVPRMDEPGRLPGDLFSQKQRKAKLRPPVLVRGLLRTCLNS